MRQPAVPQHPQHQNAENYPAFDPKFPVSGYHKLVVGKTPVSLHLSASFSLCSALRHISSHTEVALTSGISSSSSSEDTSSWVLCGERRIEMETARSAS